MTVKTTRFARYAWGVLAYTILVILWGAFVRATGSGAGCGSHWPRCNGEIIPIAPSVETMIEFSHRLTSGIALLMVVGLFLWARRLYPKGHIVRFGAKLSLFFIILEALIGAVLVLFEWVAFYPSVERAVAVALHLVNTFVLLGIITLTAWWASGGKPFRLRNQGSLGWMLGIGFVGMLLVGASGAVTALGDTLFPAGSLREGIQQDFSPTAHFLVRLRIWHPVLAIATSVYIVAVGSVVRTLRSSRLTSRWFWTLAMLFAVQLVAGALNVWLLVPVWMQIIHLLLADFVWIVFVLLSAAALAQTAPQPASEALEPWPASTLEGSR